MGDNQPIRSNNVTTNRVTPNPRQHPYPPIAPSLHTNGPHTPITPAQAIAYLLQPLANDPVLGATATGLLSAVSSINAEGATAEAVQQASNAIAGLFGAASLVGLTNAAAAAAASSTTNNNNVNNNSNSNNNSSREKNSGSARSDTAEAARKKSKDSNRFQCEQCGRVFGRQYNLSSHLKTHQTDKPFECVHCEARFARNHDLNRHKKIHSKEKIHTCPHCGRTFARRDALRRHEKMDPDGKRLHCSVQLNPTAAQVIANGLLVDKSGQIPALADTEISGQQQHAEESLDDDEGDEDDEDDDEEEVVASSHSIAKTNVRSFPHLDAAAR
ncbi:hypothetical protein SmJEL517_g01874 [Synchytrium microbalum]|uniref:C2H2-type domain-containing protein n=1 Tax=Synchytrium microbalum TaxID=1806994 RepID=A0A507C2P1_9FUNG|nr:uncharacterized protein SmJEL517_g01874 [Synchytrium microbalum]TPX35770.1 hypothetical protein SmJEL517_g01874 [Synchytrium microbalum]